MFVILINSIKILNLNKHLKKYLPIYFKYLYIDKKKLILNYQEYYTVNILSLTCIEEKNYHSYKYFKRSKYNTKKNYTTWIHRK